MPDIFLYCFFFGIKATMSIVHWFLSKLLLKFKWMSMGGGGGVVTSNMQFWSMVPCMVSISIQFDGGAKETCHWSRHFEDHLRIILSLSTSFLPSFCGFWGRGWLLHTCLPSSFHKCSNGVKSWRHSGPIKDVDTVRLKESSCQLCRMREHCPFGK